MWQWMKHGSTTTHLKQKDRQLSGQQRVKAVQSDEKLNSGLERLWHLYFGTRMVFCLSTILRKVEPLTATITWHYLIDWAQKSRKMGLACKRSAVLPRQCTVRQVHEKTIVKLNELSFDLLLYPPYSSNLPPPPPPPPPPPTTGSFLTWKKYSRERDFAPMMKWLPKLRPLLRAKTNHSTKKASKS